MRAGARWGAAASGSALSVVRRAPVATALQLARSKAAVGKGCGRGAAKGPPELGRSRGPSPPPRPCERRKPVKSPRWAHTSMWTGLWERCEPFGM